jgi:carbon storage regulator
MLVLTRKTRESILIGHDIRVTIDRIDGQRVRIGIEAPEGVKILREELADLPEAKKSAKVK